MNDRSTVDAIDGVQDSLAQFLRRGDADVAEHGAGELGEEALDEIEPGAVLGREYEGEASFGSLGEPSPGFLGFVGGVIVENDLDRGLRRVGGVERLRSATNSRERCLFSTLARLRGFIVGRAGFTIFLVS